MVRGWGLGVAAVGELESSAPGKYNAAAVNEVEDHCECRITRPTSEISSTR